MPQLDDSQPNETSRARRHWLDVIVVGWALLSCAIWLGGNVADPDLWGHIQYGRDLIRDGLPATTTYSFTAEGHPWINHENVAELLLATGIDTIGPSGLLICKCLIGLGVIGLMIWVGVRCGAPVTTAALLTMLVAANLSHFWCLRPQLLSYLYFAIMLALLHRCFDGRRAFELLWLAPPLFALWTNSHGGFVAGFCVFAFYLMLRGTEELRARGREAVPFVAQLAAVVVVSAAATLVNPYGIGLHMWMFESLGVPRPEIIEWLPPDMTSMVTLPLWCLIGAFTVSVLFSDRPRDITQLATLIILLWQCLEHARHIPFFAIACGFWLTPHLDSALQRLRAVKGESLFSPNLRPTTQRAITLFLCGWILLMGVKLQRQLAVLVVDRAYYPVAAVEFMAKHQLTGKLVVNYNWAQYVITAVGTDRAGEGGVRVAFDGRFRTSYPQDIVDMNFDFTLGMLEQRYRDPKSGPFDDERVLDHGEPDLVLISRLLPHGVNVMFRNSDKWTLLYQDGLAQLWGRSGRFDDESSPHFLSSAERKLTEAPQFGPMRWPALPRS